MREFALWAMMAACVAAAPQAEAWAQAKADLFQSFTSSIRIALPRNFLTNGTGPVDQTLLFAGSPLGSRGALELGTANAVWMRESVTPPLSGQTFLIDIQMVELSLTAVTPLMVTRQGKDQPWDVDVAMLPVSNDRNVGTMTLAGVSGTGGSADLDMPVKLEFTFTGPNGEVATDVQTFDLEASGVPWTTLCPTSVLQVPLIGGEFCFGVEDSGGVPGLAMVDAAFRMDIFMIPASQTSGPPPEIDPTAEVDPTAVLGSGVRVGANAVIGPGVVIGPNAFIGDSVMIGENAVIGGNGGIEAGSTVGAGAVIGNQVAVGFDVSIGPGAVVDDGSLVGSDGSVAAGATVAGNVEIGENVDVQAGAQIRQGSQLGDNVTVAAGNRLAAGSQITAGTTQTESTHTCQFANGQTIAGTVEECRLAGAAVHDCVEPPVLDNWFLNFGMPAGAPPGEAKGRTWRDLERDVDASMVAEDNGGLPYSIPENDCDDYARDLEEFLEAQGWDATYTLVLKSARQRFWYNPWSWFNPVLVWEESHALVDVHVGDRIFWVEPQRTAAQGAIFEGIRLDEDNDGVVEFEEVRGDTPTDGSLRIEIYENREAAVLAGWVMD